MKLETSEGLWNTTTRFSVTQKALSMVREKNVLICMSVLANGVFCGVTLMVKLETTEEFLKTITTFCLSKKGREECVSWCKSVLVCVVFYELMLKWNLKLLKDFGTWLYDSQFLKKGARYGWREECVGLCKSVLTNGVFSEVNVED